MKLLKMAANAWDRYRRGTPEWYAVAYHSMTFDRGLEAQIEKAARRVLLGKERYQEIERRARLPWQMIGGIHNMESSCNFNTYLGNGQSLNKKTTIVPKGRGPFLTWEDGAMDALKLQGLVGKNILELGVVLKECEAYNGLGYLLFHTKEMSPYLWACTSINDGAGKYVADGKWSETANANTQVGVAAILKQLEIWGEYKPL